MDYNVSYRKKDGGIQCIIAYKDGDTWRQRNKQGFKTQKESKDWQEKTIKELKKSIKIPVDYRGMTFGKFKKIFKDDMEKVLAYNSIEFFDKAFKRFEDLDPIALDEISYQHIKPCVDKMIDLGFKDTTIKDYLSKIKTVLNHAIDNYKIIKENPVDIEKYKIPTSPNDKKIKALNRGEVDDLLSKLDGRDYIISLIAVKGGLRIGEIIGLVDSNEVLNYKDSEIKVKQQWKKISAKEHRLGTLKSANSYRIVPFPRVYMDEIKEYTKTCVKDMNNRIFIDQATNGVTSRLSQKYKRLGFNISVHDLRHTYATTLIANGVDYETVANLIGDTVQMVIETYSHFNDDMMCNVKSTIENIL